MLQSRKSLSRRFSAARWRVLLGAALALAAAFAMGAPVPGQGTWETTLHGRLPLTPGGTDYRAYYDTVLDVTWVADANLARTSGYDDDGRMGALNGSPIPWIVALNEARYLGADDWRPPLVADTGPTTCDVAFTGTDCGWNVDLATGELAHLFYSTLGNSGAYDTSGVLQPCYYAIPFHCLTNTGPFSNVQTVAYYWSLPPIVSGHQAPFGRNFNFGRGAQLAVHRDGEYHVWAVRDGDIAVVPVPGVGWLLGGALGLLGARYRHRRPG